MRSLWLLLAAVMVFFPAIAPAESTTANLQVSAQVLAHARIQDNGGPVTVTASDVQRGYVDVSRHYQLRTNVPDRVVLQFNPRVGLTRAIDVNGLQVPLRMGDTSLEITQPVAQSFTLSYRLWLNEAAVPGDYPLPLQLAAVVR